MIKKILVSLCSVIILITCVVPAFAAEPIYQEKICYELKAKSEVRGDNPNNGNETFIVTAIPDEKSPKFEKERIEIKANEYGSFGEIYSDKPEIFTYILSQEKGTNENILYDTSKFKVVITILTDEKGLVAEEHSITNLKTGEKVEEVNFINIYESPTPKTGDSNNSTFWGILLVAFLIVLDVALLFYLNFKTKK